MSWQHTGIIEKLKFDSTVGGLEVTSTVHTEVHEGETFRFWYVVPHGSELANDGTIDIVLTTTTKTAHIVFASGGGGDFEFELFRDVAFDGDGTPLSIHNLNDASTNISTVSAVLDPTVTLDGTQIDGEFSPGGSGGNAPGGAIRDETEDIWKASTSYLIRLTNRSGGAQQFSIEGQWYEES